MASRRVPRLICSASDSSVSTRWVPCVSCPVVIARRSAVRACSRRLVFSNRSKDASIDIGRSLTVNSWLSTVMLQPVEYRGDDARRRQPLSVVQRRQRPSGEKLVGQGDRRDLPAQASPQRLGCHSFEQPSDNRVVSSVTA